MPPKILALVSAAALFSSHFLGAQAPPPAELVRDKGVLAKNLNVPTLLDLR